MCAHNTTTAYKSVINSFIIHIILLQNLQAIRSDLLKACMVFHTAESIKYTEILLFVT